MAKMGSLEDPSRLGTDLEGDGGEVAIGGEVEEEVSKLSSKTLRNRTSVSEEDDVWGNGGKSIFMFIIEETLFDGDDIVRDVGLVGYPRSLPQEKRCVWRTVSSLDDQEDDVTCTGWSKNLFDVSHYEWTSVE